MSGCDYCEGAEASALLERARVVGLLDATDRGWSMNWKMRGYCCDVLDRRFWGETADEARSAAAKAIESGEFR